MMKDIIEKVLSKHIREYDIDCGWDNVCSCNRDKTYSKHDDGKDYSKLANADYAKHIAELVAKRMS